MKSWILIFLLVGLKAQAEKVVKGIVLDAGGGPVAFASIGIPGTSCGTVADSSGKFILFIAEDVNRADSLKISCIGFFEKFLQLDKTSGFVEIRLHEKTDQLPEIEVRPVALRKKTLGNTREHTFLACNFAISKLPGQNLGAEIGRKFFLKGKRHYINEVALYMATNFDTVVFRLNIYSLKQGMPAENLLRENIILTTSKRFKGWARFDLRKYHLAFDQDIVVGIEWIGHSKKGKVILMNLTFPSPGAVHYYKFGSQNKWKKYPQMSAAISLETETE